MSAEGRCIAVAILIVGSGVCLAIDLANAETTATAAAKLEGLESADSGIRDSASTAPDAEQREATRKWREEWWTHAHEVLFRDIQLSAEQSRRVDEIIEARLAQQESAAIGAQRESPHETMEELRALLSKEEHPTFDMNRAHLVAESQQPQKKRRNLNRLPRVEVKAE
jgi:Spy/CpxP family protein refolding chaperone